MTFSPTLKTVIGVVLSSGLAGAVHSNEELLTTTMLRPAGQYEQAVVPDTLDLADRAALVVRGITSFLNERQDYAPYGHAFFNVSPPFMTNDWAEGAHNWGKVMEALIMARIMSGSTENMNVQMDSLVRMIRHIETIDGQMQFEGKPVSGAVKGRILMTLMSLHQQQPNEPLWHRLQDLMAAFLADAKQEGDKAWFFDGPPRLNQTALGVNNYGWNMFINGTALRTLSRWYAMSGDARALEIARKVQNYLLQEKFWQSEAEPKTFVSADHAHFQGHHHSYCAALMGLLRYAAESKNTRLLQFVRDGYEYLRNLGIARMGLYGESCTIGDMTWLAVHLSRLGVGDYWEDVDLYVRNHLTEVQITDTERLRKASERPPVFGKLVKGGPYPQRPVGQMPPPPPLKPESETEHDVLQRCLGTFLSDAGCPTHIPKQRFLWTICCTGNCPPGLFFAWQNTVTFNRGSAQVNLLLNRASPWLDVDSFLPYEGKVLIKNKQSAKLYVRIPLWVNKAAVKVQSAARNVPFIWLSNYLLIESVGKTDVLSITFPIESRTETYTLKWKESDFWKESTNPGPDWQPLEPPDRFTLHFKGNTIVDITPRPVNAHYPLYLRNHLRRDEAPLKNVNRFIAQNWISW